MASHRAPPMAAAPPAAASASESHNIQAPPPRPNAGGPTVVIPRTRNLIGVSNRSADIPPLPPRDAMGGGLSMIGSVRAPSNLDSLARSASALRSHSTTNSHASSLAHIHPLPVQSEAGLWKYPISDGPLPRRSESVTGHSNPRHTTSSLSFADGESYASSQSFVGGRLGPRSNSTPPVITAPYYTDALDRKTPVSHLASEPRSRSPLISSGNTTSVHEALHYTASQRDFPASSKGTTEFDRESRLTRNEARLNRMRESQAKAEHVASELEQRNESRMNARIDSFKNQSDTYNNTFANINNKPHLRRSFLQEAGHRELYNRRAEIYAGNPAAANPTFQSPTKQEIKVSSFLRTIANS